MATKPNTKTNRAAERQSSRSQAANRKRAAQTSAPSALDLLEQDHRQVEQLFAQYDELKEDNGSKEELAQKICLALEVHAQIEEELFYPKAREATKDNDLINESLVGTRYGEKSDQRNRGDGRRGRAL
jgi:hemerythrin superfamily protein